MWQERVKAHPMEERTQQAKEGVDESQRKLDEMKGREQERLPVQQEAIIANQGWKCREDMDYV